MKEYIEREKAIALFYPVDPENDGSDGCTIVYKSGNFSSSEIEAMMSDLPTADVAEVRHGRWIFEPGKIPYCLECKEYSDDGDKGATFCSWCGARMDKEDEHES